ncbi:two-component system sensor histidine kinase RppB [Lyngbya sp. PCC 8106]|uniref:two-component system sensor histidine kinase RppB n=1 Tax=Lyngbya sp. (strain PCC 8106) TaxID=313612 RepID=UPI0000EAD5A1|nr:two-component system sensor histidine kinase RppB [Lyngbya sp. PCC 8106]EAW37675.1 two-component sensor histidine kinase [Lyngbya sp. PCC 8106]
MKQNQLFQQTRWRIASWYVGVMGIILSLSGFGVYEAIVHAHKITVDREIEAVAGTLHDSLETVFKTPEQFEPDIWRILPDLCVIESENDCQSNTPDSAVNHRHFYPSPLHQYKIFSRNYYSIRLLNSSGNLIAVSGSSLPTLASKLTSQPWQTLEDNRGSRYLFYSTPLHTRNNQIWGRLQLGRSLQDFDQYLANVRLMMGLGLPLSLISVAIASWKLAGIAMQPIYQSYQQIQQFTADAAHELRTPLAAIRATLESTLNEQTLSKNQARETLEVIERQNHRLSQLVQDLLLLSRMEQKIESSSKNLCCLNDLISDTEEEIAALAIQYQVTLKTEICVKKPVVVKGNEAQLYRVIFNLATNGIQYTLPGGKVSIILESSLNYAIIQVQDTGIGISPEDQTKIFDRFYRINSDRSRSTGGSGLGLAIVTAIIRAHQGTIEIQSEKGKGSIFMVKLPLKS